jgi:hypothetical protein
MPLGSSLPAPLPESTGTNYFVSTTGNDTTGTGSIGNPWLTVTKALQQKGTEAGAIINLRDGTYVENVNVANCHGTALNPITIQPYQGEDAIVKKASAAGSNFPFTLNNWDYARLRGLIIDGDHINNSGVEDADVYLTGGSTFITIEQCEVKNSYEQGILFDDGIQDCQIIRNWIHDGGTDSSGNKDHALYIQGDRHAIYNNLIGDWEFGHCVQLFPNANDFIFANNTIYHTDYVLGGYHSSAILLGSSASDSGDSSDHVIVNNLIYAAANGIEAYNSLGQVKSLSGGGITLPQGTITLNSVTSMDTTNGQVSIGDVNNETVSNALVAYQSISGNTLLSCTTLIGSGTTWANGKMVIGSPTDYVSGSGSVAHHNAIWDIVYMPKRCDPCSGPLPTIDFQGDDIETDPLVVSDAGRDYHLLPNSPLYGNGVDAYCPTTDFDGNARVVATIGAFRAVEEEDPPAATPAPWVVGGLSLASILNTIKTVTVSGYVSGQFNLRFLGYVTANIDFDGTAAEVQAALEGLDIIDPGDVLCTPVTLGGATLKVAIEFTGKFSGQPPSRLTTHVVLGTLADEGTTTVANTQTGAGAQKVLTLT